MSADIFSSRAQKKVRKFLIFLDFSFSLPSSMQIVLSELLGVPTTIESGFADEDGSMNFYDPALRFSYSEILYVRKLT